MSDFRSSSNNKDLYGGWTPRPRNPTNAFLTSVDHSSLDSIQFRVKVEAFQELDLRVDWICKNNRNIEKTEHSISCKIPEGSSEELSVTLDKPLRDLAIKFTVVKPNSKDHICNSLLTLDRVDTNVAEGNIRNNQLCLKGSVVSYFGYIIVSK